MTAVTVLVTRRTQYCLLRCVRFNSCLTVLTGNRQIFSPFISSSNFRNFSQTVMSLGDRNGSSAHKIRTASPGPGNGCLSIRDSGRPSSRPSLRTSSFYTKKSEDHRKAMQDSSRETCVAVCSIRLFVVPSQLTPSTSTPLPSPPLPQPRRTTHKRIVSSVHLEAQSAYRIANTS